MKAYTNYKKIKADWISSLPSHWEALPVKYACTYNDEVLHETTDPDALIEYVEISDVDEVNGIKSSESMAFKDAPSRARRLVREGDVLISTVRTYLRAVAPVKNPPSNLVVSTGFAVIRPQKLAPSYARYALVADGFIGSMIASSKGVSYPAISASDLVRIHVPVPPTDEQVAIASYLDTETKRIDRLIEAKKLLVKTLLEMRSSFVTEAITKGVRPNRKMCSTKLSWVSELPEGWRHVPLKRFSRLIGGHTPSTENPRYWEGSIPWFSPKDMKSDELDDSIDHVTELAVEDCALQLIKPNTTMIVVRGMILAHTFPVCVTRVEGTINQDMKALVADESIHPKFLPWLLRGAAPMFLSLTEQSAHGTMALRTERFMSEPLPIPPLDEQLEIVLHLEAERVRINDLVAQVQSEIELLGELRSSTITDAVLGRIDVSDFAPH